MAGRNAVIEKKTKKHCCLKSLNHEEWDLMDLWVELTCTCSFANFKVLSRKVELSKLFAMMHSKKVQTVSSFLGDKLTTSPVQGTSEISV